MTKVYLKLDDKNAGENAMLKDSNALNHQVFSIQMVETNINISKNSFPTFKRTQFLMSLAWASLYTKFKVLHFVQLFLHWS